MPGMQWVEQVAADLRSCPDVQVLTRATAFGYQSHNLVTVCHRLTDHLPIHGRRGVRERLLKVRARAVVLRSEEHTSELQSLMRISYAVFCLKKKKENKHRDIPRETQSNRNTERKN